MEARLPQKPTVAMKAPKTALNPRWAAKSLSASDQLRLSAADARAQVSKEVIDGTRPVARDSQRALRARFFE